MALPVSWNGDGLSAGTLTTSSVGTGDTALGSIGGSTNLTIDNSGTTAPRIRMAGTLANIYAGWNSTALGTITNYVVSAYFVFDTLTTAQWTICSGNNTATVQWRLDIAGTTNSGPGRLRLRNNTTQVGESLTALSAATLYRLEVAATGSAITATVYVGTGSTVAATVSGTAQSGSVDNVRFGNFSSSTTNPVMYFDRLSVAYPVLSGGAVTATATTTATGTGSVVPVPPPPAPAPMAPGYEPPERSGFLVVVRDEDLNRVGAIAPLELTFTPRWNDVGEWSLTIPADGAGADLLRAPGAGVIIYRAEDMTVLMSGPVGERKLTQTDNGYLLTVSGPDDNVWIASRLAYQMPGRTAPNQGTPSTGALSHDRRSGPAETVIKGYVEANAGQTALTARRIVTVEPVAVSPRGTTVSGAARMTPLLDLIRGLAATGGIGFNVAQDGTNLVFDVHVPTDRTGTARFSTQLGNLESFEFVEKAPSASYVVAAGQGQGISRVFRDQTDTQAITAWPRWRMEKFIDQRQAENDTAGNAEIDQAIAEELLSGGPQTSLAIVTRDIPQLQFGAHFFVGDKVTVEPRAGQAIRDVLREVTVTWTADEGVQVVSHVGSSETTGTPRLIQLVRRLQSRSQAVNTVE